MAARLDAPPLSDRHHPVSRIALVFATLVALPASAMAEEGWRFTGTAYGWFPSVDTTVETPRGDVDAEIDFSDILEKLDFAFFAALEARKGRFALVGDRQYIALGAEASPHTALINSVEIDSQMTNLGDYVLYDIYDKPETRIEIGGGVRFYNATFDTVVSGAFPLTVSSEGNWADAVLSMRVTHAFNEDWFGVAYADVGGFGLGNSSGLTMQGYLAVGYRVSDTWSAVAGYRHLMFEREFHGSTITSNVGGPVLGFQKQF